MNNNKRLILEIKPDECFVLYDCQSCTTTTIKAFYRDNGYLALIFEAPKTVRISRDQQRSALDGQRD